MAGYSKLDCGIIHSTVWQEPHDVRVAWITLLAMTDAEGYVRAALPAVAKLVDVPIPRMQEIIVTLCSPDEYSRTRDFDGKRLEAVDGGWRILNYVKYREGLRQPDTTNSKRQERHRNKQKQTTQQTPIVTAEPLRAVTNRYSNAYAEAEADAEAEAIKESTTYYSAEPEADSTLQPVCEPVMKFPIIGGKGQQFGLSQSKLDEWMETYGDSLNVPHELRTARQWLLDNPKRQKTHTGMTKFLGAWLDRAQNRRGGKQEKMTLPGMAVGEYGENE